MNSSHDSNDTVDSSAHNMLRILNELMALKPTVSNGAKIMKKLAELQSVYHHMDEASRTVIHDELIIKNKGLMDALEKKGSKIVRPLDLARDIAEDLPEQLQKVITANPSLFKARTTAIPTHPLPEDDEFIMPTDTVRVVHDSEDSHSQYQDALSSVATHQDPTSYIANVIYGAGNAEPVDPATACIDALEIIRKSRLNYLKCESDKLKPANFNAIYCETMLRQIHTLHRYRNLLKQFQLNNDDNARLAAIHIRLSPARTQDSQEMLKLAEGISELVDEPLVKKMRDTLEQPTPRPKSGT